MKDSSLMCKLLALFTKKQKRNMVIILVFFFFSSVFQLVGVAAIFPFMNIVTNPDSIHTNPILRFLYELFRFKNIRSFIIFGGLSMFLLIVFSNALAAFTTWLKTKFIMSLNHNLSRKLLGLYLSRPYTFFLTRSSSDLGANILYEVNQLTNQLLIPAFDLLIEALIVLAMIIFLLFTDFWTTVVAFSVIGGAYVITNTMARKRTKRAGAERVAANKGRFASTNEAILGIKITKVLGRESFFLESFTNFSERFIRVESYIQLVRELPKYILEAIAFGGVLLLVVFMTLKTNNVLEILPFVTLFAFAGYKMMPALQTIYRSVMSVYFNRPIVDILYKEMVETKSPESPFLEEKERQRLPFEKSIELKDVEFSYNRSDIPTLRNISLSIEKNSSVAFVGSTGSGKTTLVDVILGLLEPRGGTILIDGTPLTAQNVRSWQANIGYVPQEVFLTDDTIARNIAFGIPAEMLDMEKVRTAARIAALEQFIDTELPEGFETIVGERGIRLSGGQRQRIGLARALYNNPEILILDEATSALDGTTETAVMEAIQAASSNRTMIMIAHRISTVRECHTIHLLHNGKIVDAGSYAELLERSSQFRKMAKV
ncbi:MAG: ABC transporter ATP-binding protein [Sphaerochaetaceae bacterium]